MNDHAISAESILRALPRVLQEDEVTLGLATAIAAELNEAACKTSLASIYSNIDELDESLLDILAKDFKVDWWRADATVAEKRAALKASWYVHHHLGTREAVLLAISDFIGSGYVQEWFEYDGKPHHFRVLSRDSNAIIENYSQFLSVLRVVQRGSSVLEHIVALLQHTQTIYVGFSLRIVKKRHIGCAAPDLSNYEFLTDEDGNLLLTENGSALYL